MTRIVTRDVDDSVASRSGGPCNSRDQGDRASSGASAVIPTTSHLTGLWLSLILVSGVVSAAEHEKPVKHLARQAYSIHTAHGDASLPMEISVNLTKIHPEITRAAIVFHGKGRNVEGYFAALERAAHDAGHYADGTLLWAPQFLREEYVGAHHLPTQFLWWHAGSWTAGEPASEPLPLSSFDVIDAMLATLADRQRFLNLTTVVSIGHSGGGQLLNRYAIVGKSARTMVGVHLHADRNYKRPVRTKSAHLDALGCA